MPWKRFPAVPRWPWKRFVGAPRCVSLATVPNRWTRVPDGPPPAPPWWGAAALPLADLFMWTMLSRPQSGSLRVTWVTPATYLLSVSAAAGAILVLAVCAVALAGGGGWAPLAGMVVCAALAAGASAVGLVGLVQRRRS
jgi:hypothetical protein